MSEKSFAVASISVAIIWGTFFYPPMPHKASRAAAIAPASSDVSVDRLRAEKGSLRPATPRVRPAALNTPRPDAQLSKDCVFAGAKSAATCPPLDKLAVD